MINIIIYILLIVVVIVVVLWSENNYNWYGYCIYIVWMYCNNNIMWYNIDKYIRYRLDSSVSPPEWRNPVAAYMIDI